MVRLDAIGPGLIKARVNVEEWRAKQKDPGDLNHPSRVWTKYQRSAKAQDERDADKVEKRKTSPIKETEERLAAALDEIEQLKARSQEMKEERQPLTIDDCINALIEMWQDQPRTR